MSVVIETTIGDITVDLFIEERPIACLNFLKLCKLKYYNFNLFHTVEQGFIAQTGDPTGAGNSGSSVWGLIEGIHKRFFEAEARPKIFHTSAGLLSMVGAGKQMVGSQFFFTLADNLTSLDGNHCVIGEVVEGHDVLRKLNEAIVDESFRPFQDIRITHTVVLDDPYPDPRGFRVPSRSPSPSAERLQNGRIPADEDIDDTDGKTMEEVQEMLAEREAKARATILEIVGDLPDAEMAPPENVLFVCKLNPVTNDDDLEIIFSRFGKVKNCEVIRDKKSGDSLQYAFVEFEEQKSCEAAFFKMDNVLIDDRRIHVDFSQSVAKVKWRGKGRGVEGADGRLDFNNLRERAGPRNKYEQRRDSNPRARMTSEERRKAREERHREQKDNEVNLSHSRSRDERRDDIYRNNKQRQRNNERSPIQRRRDDSRERNRDVKRSRERVDRRRDSPDKNTRQNERRQYSRSPHRARLEKRHASRSRSRDRNEKRRYSPDRNQQERNRRSSRDRRLSAQRPRPDRSSPQKKRQQSPQERSRTHNVERRRAESRHEENRREENLKMERIDRRQMPVKENTKPNDKKNQKGVKRAAVSSSSSSSSSASSSSSSSTSNSSSSSSSESSDSDSSSERKRKKVKKSKEVIKKNSKKVIKSRN